MSTKGILVLEPHSQDLQDRTQAVAKEMAKVVILKSGKCVRRVS